MYEATGSEGEPVRAIKVVRAQKVKKRGRFLQEIRVQQRLTASGAANVVPLLDHNLNEIEDGGISGFIVMPLAKLSLEEALPQLEGRIELSLEVFAGILNGVREAHAESIVHRDLKPANILFMDASLRQPLVADFGICLLKETPDADRLTDEGETVGARYFMAPEQERGGVSDVSETADIYSLGKLLYYMLTGRKIYREEIENAFQPTEMDSDPRFKRILDGVIRRTVVHAPGDRIQTVEELITVIKRIGGDTGGGGASSSDDRAPVDPPPAPVNSGTGDAGSTTGDTDSLRHDYETFMDYSNGSLSSKYLVTLDYIRNYYSGTWKTIYEQIKDTPAAAPEAARNLILSQRKPLAFTLALGRSDSVGMFPEWKRLIEAVVREDEPRSGYAAVFEVPYVLGGFLYMAATVQALIHESWGVLGLLLNEQFEWHYRLDRPYYSYGFQLSPFFHSEALGREASKTHDLYRGLLIEAPLAEIASISSDQLLNKYLQAQLLLTLRVVQEVERGNDASIWPDYGRFYSMRVQPLFDRAHAVPTYGAGLAMAFKESPQEFFAKLNKRLAYVPKHFWSGSRFMWESLTEWAPR